MSCSRTTISKSHGIRQESQNHRGRFASAGNTNVTGARPELCDSLPRNKHNCGSRCLQGRREKHISVGQLLTCKLFTQTRCPHPCSLPPHAWLPCSSHTHALLLHALLCFTHPTIMHLHLGKAGVRPPSPPSHTPIPLTLDEGGLCLAANISRSRLFQEKPHTELTTAVMAELSYLMTLTWVTGCQCKTLDCNVGHRQCNALQQLSALFLAAPI